MHTPLPKDFRDRPKWKRALVDVQVLFRRRAIKRECCESFREEGKVACKGCATLYDPNGSSLLYRMLGRIAKRRKE